MKPSNSQLLKTLPLLTCKGIQMRTFHITWFMFFICFFGWFGLAPLMPTIRDEMGLTKEQVGNIMIASVSSTIIARLIIGRLCDVFGPRKTAVWLLTLGSLPVFLVGLAHTYETFLLFRLAIGVIGASFVITQYHTSMMFAANVKGTANAVAGGWGNLGGGVTNMLMPLIFAGIIGFGYSPERAWRYAMVIPGLLMLFVAVLYWRYTKDTPSGNFDEIEQSKKQRDKIDWKTLRDWRIWALTLAYAMCFGMEITFDNVAALHFVDTFSLSQSSAGFWAGIFGFMNLFARALGGLAADKIGLSYGIKGKGILLGSVLLLEGFGVLLFSHAGSLTFAIVSMLIFALFLKMANGVTYAIAPFVNKKNVGLVSGIVGAGGNVGGMFFGFLFKSNDITYTEAFQYIGFIVLAVACLIFITPFKKSKPNLVEEKELVIQA